MERARLALEGSGDLGAAFLKNRGTEDHQQPQSGEKGEGAERCNHGIVLLWARNPRTRFVPVDRRQLG